MSLLPRVDIEIHTDQRYSFFVGKNSECKINTGTSCSAGKTYTNSDGCVKLYYQIGDDSPMIFECNGS